jgi:cobalamin transport system substrate-binding protein
VRPQVRHRSVPVLAALAAVVGLTLGATGCAGGGKDSPGGVPSAAASFPVTVGSVTLDKQPQKIVSLSPSATEMLFAIGAGKQVVAADDNSNYPAEAPKTSLSGFKPNAEAVAAYQPDLVVLANDLEKIVASLTALKIPVYVAPAATTLDDTYRQIQDLGTLTGHGAEAADVSKRVRDDVAKLVKDLPRRTKKLTYYYELDPTLYTVTSKTFIGSLFTLAGLDNIADAADPSGSGYPQLSAEALIKANPDFVFLADTKCCQQNAATVGARSGWAALGAVQSGRIILLDDDIASRWGPRVVDLVRSIVDAVAKVPA